jgi:hypothetical protein
VIVAFVLQEEIKKANAIKLIERDLDMFLVMLQIYKKTKIRKIN